MLIIIIIVVVVVITIVVVVVITIVVVVVVIIIIMCYLSPRPGTTFVNDWAFKIKGKYSISITLETFPRQPGNLIESKTFIHVHQLFV